MQEVRGSNPFRSTQSRLCEHRRRAIEAQDLSDLRPKLDADLFACWADEDAAEQRVVHLLPLVRYSSEVARMGALKKVERVSCSLQTEDVVFSQTLLVRDDPGQRLSQLPLLPHKHIASDPVSVVAVNELSGDERP